jgi:hypothetical protein
MEEIWKDVKGYEGLYKVSSLGRVKAINRNENNLKDPLKKNKGLIKKPQLNKFGYYRMQLCKNGIRKNFFIHRLVADAFISNPKNKPNINHINCIRTDNIYKNLEWVTPSENQIHAYKYGQKSNSGENHGMSVLKNDDIINIRTGKLSKLSNKKISLILNVNPSTILKIRKRINWNHI